MQYYDETLQTLSQQKAEKERLIAKQKLLKTQEAMLTDKVKELEQIKNRETADAERLEGHSLAAFYYFVIGKKDEMLTKEREEAYAAQVKYDSAVQSLMAVRKELSDIADALYPLRNCETAYEEALAAKRGVILSQGVPEAEEILKLEALCSHLERQKKEIDEAITAGEQAVSITQSVLDSLGSAEDMGVWDVWGGGLIADVAKHNHLDKAQEKVQLLHEALRRFKTELTDVKVQAELQIHIDGFTRFADFFFDGLFADWSVLGRIRDSQAQVYEVKKQLDAALRKLRTMKTTAEKEQEKTKNYCNVLIRQASL